MAKKWLKYPNGVEVVVKAEDAEATRDNILRRQIEAKAKDKTVKVGCDILDKPSYEGGEKGVDPMAKRPAKAQRTAMALIDGLIEKGALSVPKGKKDRD